MRIKDLIWEKVIPALVLLAAAFFCFAFPLGVIGNFLDIFWMEEGFILLMGLGGLTLLVVLPLLGVAILLSLIDHRRSG